MASTEWKILTKIIDDNDMKTAVDAGIAEYVFMDDWTKKVWRHIHRYYNHPSTMGLIPTREMVIEAFKGNDNIQFPNKLPKRPELKALCMTLLRDNLETQLSQIGDELVNNMSDPDKALDFLRCRTMEMTAMRSAGTDIDVGLSADQIKRDYVYIKENRDGLGIPFPWTVLNKEKKGMQEADFIVLYGRPKSMKTWLLLAIAAHAYEKANRKVLLYTREMTPRQMRDRVMAILLGVPYSYFKDSRLDELAIDGREGRTQEDRFYEMLETMQDDEDTVFTETGSRKKLIITNDRETGIGGSISGLDAKVAQYKPDLICVDGAYLLHRDGQRENSAKWTEMVQITHALKSIAMRHNTPLVCTTQANRAGEGEGRLGSVADIAFSDSFGQDCDLALKVIKKPIDQEHNEIILLVAAARECNMEGFVVHGDAATNFGQVMQRKKDPSGTPLSDPDTGEPLMEPIVFYDRKSVRAIFKEEDRAANEAEKLRGFVKKARGMA